MNPEVRTLRMLGHDHSTCLLASNEPALLSRFEPLLRAHGARVDVSLTAESALAALTAPARPGLVLLDVNLPGMAISQLLAAARAHEGSNRYPIVLISDTVTQEWLNRLAEGVIDDVIPPGADSRVLELRVQAALRTHRLALELERISDSAALSAQYDRLTGVYNRDTLLSMLFRETDRVQRMKSSLCMVLFDVDDFGHWNSRLGAEVCDDLLCQIAARTARLLRSYDLLGRTGKDEFLVAMPGCSSVNALMLAERLRIEVFSEPCHVAGETIRLSACFGISVSNGRSPLVVLREAEQALLWARAAGPESIQCFGEDQQDMPPPVTFYSPSSGDDVLAW
jgi:two-component system cell cycle response regulator